MASLRMSVFLFLLSFLVSLRVSSFSVQFNVCSSGSTRFSLCFINSQERPQLPCVGRSLCPHCDSVDISISTQCKQLENTHTQTHTRTHGCQPRWKLRVHAGVHTLLQRTRARALTCQSSGGKNSQLRHASVGKHFILITLLFSLTHTHARSLCISVFRHYHSHLFSYFFLTRGLLPPLPHSLLNLISLSVSLPFLFLSLFPPSRCLSCETFNRRGNGFISGTEIK